MCTYYMYLIYIICTRAKHIYDPTESIYQLTLSGSLFNYIHCAHTQHILNISNHTFYAYKAERTAPCFTCFGVWYVYRSGAAVYTEHINYSHETLRALCHNL